VARKTSRTKKGNNLSDKITFTGVVLKSFSRNHKGGTARFSSNFTQTVANKMGWAGLASGQTSCRLEGDLAASNVSLQPTAGELSNWTIEFTASVATGFEALRYELEGKKGKGFRYELHFAVEFKDMTACRFLEEFITHVGEHKSTLSVSYTQAAEQTDLVDDNTPTLDGMRRQATMEDD
jgi:hypothetical protein